MRLQHHGQKLKKCQYINITLYGRIMFFVFTALLNYKRDRDEHTLFLSGKWMHPCFVLSHGLQLYQVKIWAFITIHKKNTHMLYLHIRPGPCIGELVDIYIPYCESLQGLFCFSVIIQRRLLLNEVRKSRFQFCGEERMRTVIFCAITLKICFKWMN